MNPLSERPDCPLTHKCEKCEAVADSVTCMYHVPSKSVKYRYLCHECMVAVHMFQMGLGLEPVSLEENGEVHHE